MRSDILVPLTPAFLILLACAGWPVAAWVALAYLTVGTAAIDAAATRTPQEKPVSRNVSLLLGGMHFLVLLACVVTISSTSGGLGIVLFLAAGFYVGQVSNSAAHELIHSSSSISRNVGRWVYISLLFGHHASAHTKIHHRYVATPDDPNSARPDESLYHFLPRAWVGSFRKGLRAEQELLRGDGLRAASFKNPYWLYLIGGLATLLVSYLAAGRPGITVHIALAGWATTQLLAADYVQHYGLRRKARGGGYEPIGLHHSWNAPKIASALLMQQSPFHSNHHIGRLSAQQTSDQPTLPLSLPAMVTLAFFPSAFRRVMNRALAKLDGPGESDRNHAKEMPA